MIDNPVMLGLSTITSRKLSCIIYRLVASDITGKGGSTIYNISFGVKLYAHNICRGRSKAHLRRSGFGLLLVYPR